MILCELAGYKNRERMDNEPKGPNMFYVQFCLIPTSIIATCEDLFRCYGCYTSLVIA